MKAVETPKILLQRALDLENRNGNGFLLSGGCDLDGKVPLEGYYDILSKIKDKTSLLINVHTGIPTKEMSEKLALIPIDVVSYDMIGSNETIKDVYRLNKSVKDFIEGYDRLKEAGLKVIPHVTIGLHRGEIKGEHRALDIISESETIVLNSLIPSPNFGHRVYDDDYLSVLDYALMKTEAEIIIGCMRERGRYELEIEALKRGVNGMVMPNRKSIEWAEEKFDIEIVERCCAL